MSRQRFSSQWRQNNAAPRRRAGRRARGLAARRGVVLLAVLVVVTILALGAYAFFNGMFVEARAAQMYGRTAQAQMLADSGIELTMTLLANPDLLAEMGGNIYDNPAAFDQMLVRQDEQPRWQGRFSILATVEGDPNGQAVRFGLSDESARLNLNALMQLDSSGDLAALALAGLPGMTEDMADAIIDWLDSNTTARTFGAEDEYYGLEMTKNGPLDTLEELLQVRGVLPSHLLGEDYNRNGLLDPNEDDSSLHYPDDNADGRLDQGWLPYVTLSSQERNVSSDGSPRINLNDSDLDGLTQQLQEEFGEEVANFVRLYRENGPYQEPDQSSDGNQPQATDSGGSGRAGPNQAQQGGGNSQISSILDLIGARVQQRAQNSNQNGQGASGNAPGSANQQAGQQAQQSGQGGQQGQQGQGGQEQNEQPPIIESPLQLENVADYLPLWFDRVTTREDEIIVGRVNVNVAPRAVLAGLPGMDDGILEQIVAAQYTANTSGEAIFATPAWLLIENIVTLDEMKQLEPWVTTRGGVFRLQVVGYFDQGGPTARVEAIIDTTSSGPPRLLYWRDLSELGEGFRRSALRGAEQQ